MEHITDADYLHPKTVSEDFQFKKLGKYHDLDVQSDTLLLAAVFENFRNMCVNNVNLIMQIFFQLQDY